MAYPVSEAVMAKKRTQNYRRNARAKGGVIVYAMITSPEAVEAWSELQDVYGSNRDALEAAIIDSYKNLLGDS